MYDRYTPDRDHSPDRAQHEPEDDHRADPEVEGLEGEEEHTGRAHRDRDPDALHDCLHREPFPDRDDLVGGVDRRARRAVGRRDVGDAQEAGQREQGERRGTGPRGDEGHGSEHSDDDGRVQDQAQP